jgi:hypothetical protein
MTEPTPGQIACQAWADAHGNPVSFRTWDTLPEQVREKWEKTAAAVRRPVAADLTPAQCEALRRMTEEWGAALDAVRSAVDLLGARIHSAEDARVITGARDALRVLEGAEADAAAADPRSPAPAAAEPVAPILGPSEGKDGGEEDAGIFGRLLRIVRDVDAHLDANTADAYREQPLAGHWARITKVCEEAGEVWAALSKCTGENPRKGVCGTWDDLLAELGDTASAAWCAVQHVTKDEARTAAVIVAAFEKAHRRVAEVESRHA